MQTETKVVVIGIDELNILLKRAISAELQSIKDTLNGNEKPKANFNGKYRIKEVAASLGICTRTIREHCKRGYFPEPHRDAVGRPYWTQEQLDEGVKLRQFKGKYPV